MYVRFPFLRGGQPGDESFSRADKEARSRKRGQRGLEKEREGTMKKSVTSRIENGERKGGRKKMGERKAEEKSRERLTSYHCAASHLLSVLLHDSRPNFANGTRPTISPLSII